jgi:hypothetical protein
LSEGTLLPPLLAISRCFSAVMDANPRFDVPLPSAIAASAILDCSCSTNSAATWAFRKVLAELQDRSEQKKLGFMEQHSPKASI